MAKYNNDLKEKYTYDIEVIENSIEKAEEEVKRFKKILNSQIGDKLTEYSKIVTVNDEITASARNLIIEKRIIEVMAGKSWVSYKHVKLLLLENLERCSISAIKRAIKRLIKKGLAYKGVYSGRIKNKKYTEIKLTNKTLCEAENYQDEIDNSPF